MSEFLPKELSESESDSDCEEEFVQPKEDCFMELSETFNQHKLNHIIQNQDEFKKQMRNKCFENDRNPFTIVQKYLIKSRHGKINVKYKQNVSHGRFHAIKSLSMQNMPREIRHTIANEFYIDIDMVNAHPVILLHLCHQRDMFPKVLKKYVKNRDKVLNSMKVDRDTAKMTILSMINGGNNAYETLEYKPKILKDFKKEITIIHKMFATDKAFKAHMEKREDDGFHHNHQASYLNTLLCDFENTILQNIYKYFGNPKDAVLCFDGLMLRKGEIYNLKKCEEFIYEQLNIQIELKIKPMDGGFDIKKCINYNEPETELYTDFESFVGKEVYGDLVSEWLNNGVVLINNGGNPFFMTKNMRIDSSTKEESIYYKQVSEKTLMNNLRVKCLVLNENYDHAFTLKYYDTPEKERPKLTPDLKLKLEPFLYNILGPNIGLTGKGFVYDAIFNRKLPSKNNVEFYPYLARNGEPTLYNCFNIFTGFPLEKIPLTLQENFEQSLLYKHLGDEMMNSDVGELNHFLDHIADMIQQPHIVRGPSHLFYTSPGMGKGMLALFMSRLLGQDHVITFGNISDYFNHFNSEQSNKILKIFEEVSDKGEAFHKHDRLKGDQTKTHERIEPKGVDAYSIRHCARYWYYTNNANALYIENNDRRHTMHRSNNRYADNTEYFDKLWVLVKDVSFCRMAFEYFATRTYTEKNVLTAYNTKYKQEQKISNMPNGIKYIVELIESNFEGVERDEDKVNAKTLSNGFKDWCSDNGVKYSLNAFKSQIQKIGLMEPKNLRINGKQAKCYIINVDEMRLSFKGYLKDANFDFDIVNDDE